MYIGKYEIEKTYVIDCNKLKMCEYGFHFCRYPCDILKFYPNNHIITIVKAEDVIIESFDKCVTSCITIIKVITHDELLLEMPLQIKRINGIEEWHKNDTIHRDGEHPAIIYGALQKWIKKWKITS